jgi:hypothetical protein
VFEVRIEPSTVPQLMHPIQWVIQVSTHIGEQTSEIADQYSKAKRYATLSMPIFDLRGLQFETTMVK